VKIAARAIAAASFLLGIFLVSRTYRLERQYTATMPRDRDIAAGRTVPELVRHETTVYVTESEAKDLEASRTYSTFGGPFAVLGVLLAAGSRNRRPPIEAAPESQSPWTARR
jgi:hypothetical protein